MKLVEIIKGFATSDITVNEIYQLILSIGKEPVLVKVDQAGFIVNRHKRHVVFRSITAFGKKDRQC